MTAASQPEIAQGRTVSLGELFMGFMQTGLSGFGGVLPHARRTLVEKRGWLTEAEFVEVISLGQFLPGPNIVNVSIVVGARFQGVLGSIAAALGLTLAPAVLVVLVGMVFARYGDLPAAQRMLNNVSSAAAGLIVALGLRMARTLERRIWVGLVLAAAFGIVGLLRWPMAWALAALIPLGVTAAFVWRK